jgi:fused signal recognition particle receptor
MLNLINNESTVFLIILGTFTVLLIAVFFVVWKSHQNSLRQQQLENRAETEVSKNETTSPFSADVEFKSSTASQPVEVVEVNPFNKTKEHIWGRIQGLFKNEQVEQNLEILEEVLYTSDIGPKTVEGLIEKAKADLSSKEKSNIDNLKSLMKSEFQKIFNQAHISEPQSTSPFQYLNLNQPTNVWLVVGVNGAGKTTSIGKIAYALAQNGKKVLVAAGDTFRAAAGAQLKVWTERAQVEIFSPEKVTDPSAVAFEAVQKGKAGGFDVVIIDTAGRLHTQVNLMEELKKMRRVVSKALDGAPHEALIVLDASSGQNALIQAKQFNEALQLTGSILTKMDGTGKGGVAVGVANELLLPIRLIGVGEKKEDLRPFSPKNFIDGIFGDN